MKNFLTAAATIFVASVVITASAWSQVSVPNTFSAGFAAEPEKLNENFQVLEDAINTNGDTITTLSGTAITGYSSVPPFPSSATEPENLVILREMNTDGTIAYRLRIAYIANDGTAIWDFASVNTAADGTTVTSWSNLRWESPTAATLRVRTEIIFNREFGSPPLAVPSVVSGIEDQEEFCFNPRVDSVARYCIERAEQTLAGHPNVGRVDYRVNTRIPMLGSSADRAVGNSVTINGITFTDIAYRFDVRDPFSNRIRIIANGIGLIYHKTDGTIRYHNTQEIIWYRVNGATAGSLAGSPFDAGGDAVGVFFTP